MHLTPRELDKLVLHQAGFLAQKRLARGLRLNYPEAVALIATQIFFPQRYWEYIFHLHLAWLVLLRNLILVALLATLSLPARGPARSS